MNSFDSCEGESQEEHPTRAWAARTWTKYRSSLLLHQPLMATLALYLELCPVLDERVPTAATDGERLYVNPHFLVTLTAAERVFVLAHETWHCALLHSVRRGEREAERWNVAADHEVNDLLRRAGMTVPRRAVHFGYLAGRTAEQVYDHLTLQGERRGQRRKNKWWWRMRPWQEPNRRRAASRAGGGRSRDAGDVVDPVGSVEADELKEETYASPWVVAVAGRRDPNFRAQIRQGSAEMWRARISWAAQSHGIGLLPQALRRLVEGDGAATVPWRAVLARFIRRVSGGAVSWTRPSRRHVHRGVYLPSRTSKRLRLAVAIDTSGSTRRMMAQFVSELRGILSAVQRYEVRVLWCDAAVHRDEVFTPERPLVLGALDVGGGGGTDYRPVFERLARAPPDGLVFLTDGQGRRPERAPGYPVVWVVMDEGARQSLYELVEPRLKPP